MKDAAAINDNLPARTAARAALGGVLAQAGRSVLASGRDAMATNKHYSVYGFRVSGRRTPEQAVSSQRKAEQFARDLVKTEGCISAWVFRWIGETCTNVYHYGRVSHHEC